MNACCGSETRRCSDPRLISFVDFLKQIYTQVSLGSWILRKSSMRVLRKWRTSELAESVIVCDFSKP